ncbi:copper resistance CopC family protein [Parageobacillus toebii]|uniref:copper resistance CopC family protein n=1 Tax=Parageobacillus toebii TaxID=153151 RepID=UPI0028165E0F|nr:copper resistance protein CopC [Parageobacillus toebii]WMT18449.1 copper resistance protein CopC [Parageobacillus toebii]
MMKKMILIMFLIFLCIPSIGYAHSYLSSSNPKERETVTTPLKTITLTFETKIEKLSTMHLFKSGNEIPFNNITVKDNQLIGTVSTPLENGSYTIVWKIVGEDGHPITGEIPFDVKVAQNKIKTPSQSTTSTTKQDGIEKNTKLEKSQKKEEDSQAKNTSSSTWIRILIVSLGIILIVGLISILKKKG